MIVLGPRTASKHITQRITSDDQNGGEAILRDIWDCLSVFNFH